MNRRPNNWRAVRRKDLIVEIRAALDEKRLSMTALARQLGFPRSTVANWLKVGENKIGIPVKHLPRVLMAVGIPYSDLEDLRDRFIVSLSHRTWAESRATETPGVVQRFFESLKADDIYFLAFVDRAPLEWANTFQGGVAAADAADRDAVAASAKSALDRGAHFLYLTPSERDWNSAVRRIGPYPFQAPTALCSLWVDSLGSGVRRERIHLVQIDGTSFFSIGNKFAGVFRRNESAGLSIASCNMLVPSKVTDFGGDIVTVSPEYLSWFSGILSRTLNEDESRDVLDSTRRQVMSLLPTLAPAEG